MNDSSRIKIVSVRGHWEVHDRNGDFIVSGDTREEAIASYEEMRYDLESADEEKDIEEDILV